MAHRIRRFRKPDSEAMLAFAQGLPEHDLLFLGRDLKHPRVVAAWLSAIDEGRIDGMIAEERGAIVGTVALVRDPLGWSAHVGEVRLLVSSARRGAGLGRDLLQAIFAVAAHHKLAKLTAAMTSDQGRSTALFESLGFEREALLKGHVRDSTGARHDLAILSLDLARASGRES